MRVVAAYLLAVLGGNAHPDAAAVTAILSSVGVEADKARVQALIDSLKGKDVYAVIKEGNAKLATMPSGGGAGAAAPAKAESKAPAKEEKKKEEPKEEVEVDMGLSLFD